MKTLNNSGFRGNISIQVDELLFITVVMLFSFFFLLLFVMFMMAKIKASVLNLLLIMSQK